MSLNPGSGVRESIQYGARFCILRYFSDLCNGSNVRHDWNFNLVTNASNDTCGVNSELL